MNYTIGICDDDPYQIEVIKGYIWKIDNENTIKVIDSKDPNQFIQMIKKECPQLIFLDIDMGTYSGLDLANQIHEINNQIVIIFITAYEKFAFDAYQTRAFHYLLKPVTLNSFKDALLEAISYVNTLTNYTDQKTFIIKTNKEILCFERDEIIYFEKSGHKIRICAKSRDVYYYDNFCNLVQKIDTNYFVRCHQGYIVNIEKIRGFSHKTLFLAGDFELPVSRSYIDDIKEVLSKKLFSEGT